MALKISFLFLVLITGSPAPSVAAPTRIVFTPQSNRVPLSQFLEVRLDVGKPDATNPFTEVKVHGLFQRSDHPPSQVEGFCDSGDARMFRIRFRPEQLGIYTYRITYNQGDFSAEYEGAFEVIPSSHPGPLVIDPANPSRFSYKFQDQPFFWCGISADDLLAQDDATIRNVLDAALAAGINLLRVPLYARFQRRNPTTSASQNVLLNPWLAQRPNNLQNPGFNTAFFNVPHWQKLDHLLHEAKERNILVLVSFYSEFKSETLDPFPTDTAHMDEQRYFRYALARYSAFSNVLWLLAHEWQGFRSEAWANQMGQLLQTTSPYPHLISIGSSNDFPFKSSPWASFTLLRRTQPHDPHGFMLHQLQQQEASGRMIPQVYLLEADFQATEAQEIIRKRLWGVYMSGAYALLHADGSTIPPKVPSTTSLNPSIIQKVPSERSLHPPAGTDPKIPPVTPWFPQFFSHLTTFFTSFPTPDWHSHNELATHGAMCLYQRNAFYALYLPQGQPTTVNLHDGNYRVRQFNPKNGEWKELGLVQGLWTSSKFLSDMAFLLEKQP